MSGTDIYKGWKISEEFVIVLNSSKNPKQLTALAYQKWMNKKDL